MQVWEEEPARLHARELVSCLLRLDYGSSRARDVGRRASAAARARTRQLSVQTHSTKMQKDKMKEGI